MTARISGVLVPLCSPCDGEDRFQVLPYQEGLRACLDAPIDGFYVCGGTGEGSRMGSGERMQACEAAVELARPAGKHREPAQSRQVFQPSLVVRESTGPARQP